MENKNMKKLMENKYEKTKYEKINGE